jgi:hypothetical protein
VRNSSRGYHHHRPIKVCGCLDCNQLRGFLPQYTYRPRPPLLRANSNNYRWTSKLQVKGLGLRVIPNNASTNHAESTESVGLIQRCSPSGSQPFWQMLFVLIQDLGACSRCAGSYSSWVKTQDLPTSLTLPIVPNAGKNTMRLPYRVESYSASLVRSKED